MCRAMRKTKRASAVSFATAAWRAALRSSIRARAGRRSVGRSSDSPPWRKHLGQRRYLPTVVAWAGTDEWTAADRIITTSGGTAHIAPPTSLGELAELARRAKLFISADTGPLHLGGGGRHTLRRACSARCRRSDNGPYGERAHRSAKRRAQRLQPQPPHRLERHDAGDQRRRSLRRLRSDSRPQHHRPAGEVFSPFARTPSATAA